MRAGEDREVAIDELELEVIHVPCGSRLSCTCSIDGSNDGVVLIVCIPTRRVEVTDHSKDGAQRPVVGRHDLLLTHKFICGIFEDGRFHVRLLRTNRKRDVFVGSLFARDRSLPVPSASSCSGAFELRSGSFRLAWVDVDRARPSHPAAAFHEADVVKVAGCEGRNFAFKR